MEFNNFTGTNEIKALNDRQICWQRIWPVYKNSFHYIRLWIAD